MYVWELRDDLHVFETLVAQNKSSACDVRDALTRRIYLPFSMKTFHTRSISFGITENCFWVWVIAGSVGIVYPFGGWSR